MALSNEKTVDALNDLVKTCLDGERGYREAADHIDDATLKRTFSERSRQRATFAAELKELVRRHGGEPAESGTAAAAAHRTWLNLRDHLKERDDEAVLQEVDRGEEHAVDVYEKALAKDLPAPVAQTVRTQASAIREAHAAVHGRAHN